MPLSSGLSSSFALSCGLLVMAPNSAQVVSLSAFTVRSGSAFPSLHQNSQPMSHGTYSASKFIRSRTMRVASITSLPTPSPGIHAILYLAIGRRLYRRDSSRKQQSEHSHLRARHCSRRTDRWRACREQVTRLETPVLLHRQDACATTFSQSRRRNELFGAAGDDQFLGGGAERREGE